MLLKLEDLSIEQKLGLVFTARSFNYSDDEDLEYTLNMIRNHALGCVQVPWRRPDIMQKVKEAADYPILIILDMEMGYPGSQLPPVPLMTLAACDRPEYYRAYARALVTDAKNAGYNGTFGPVVDVLNGDGPVRVFRHLSDDPDLICRAAEEINRVFANNSFLGCGKHYGGDRGNVDTHMATIASETTKENLVNVRLAPYRHLNERGLLPTVMAGHTVVPAVDPDYPTSLSKKMIGLLRDQGIDSLCFTDSLAMMAIMQKYGEENLLGMAIAAGNDVVLPNYRNSTRYNYELLCKNYRDGAFTEERLNEAVRRVLAAQAIVGAEPKQPDLFTEKDMDTYMNIAKDCITAVTDPGVDAALPADNKDRLFVIVVEGGSSGNELAQEIIVRDWYRPKEIEQKIHEEFSEAEVVTLPEYPTAKENEAVLLAATRHKEVVFITYCNTRPYLGTDCMTRRVESVINAMILSNKLSAVVHFGNPFALQPLRHVSRKIFGYMMPQSQLYAIEVLAGKLPAKGKLPYKVELK